MKNNYSLRLIAIFALAVLAPRADAGMVPKRSVLNNGMVLLTSEQRALPMVALELLIDAGSRHEAAQQAGLANLTSKLLIYGHQETQRLADQRDFGFHRRRVVDRRGRECRKREPDDSQKGFGGRFGIVSGDSHRIDVSPG